MHMETQWLRPQTIIFVYMMGYDTETICLALFVCFTTHII